MEDLANRLGLQRDKGLLDAAFGQSATPLERAQIAKLYKEAGIDNAPNTGGLFGSIFDTLFPQQTTGGNLSEDFNINDFIPQNYLS
jgi:hypothetical protein